MLSENGAARIPSGAEKSPGVAGAPDSRNLALFAGFQPSLGQNLAEGCPPC